MTCFRVFLGSIESICSAWKNLELHKRECLSGHYVASKAEARNWGQDKVKRLGFYFRVIGKK